MDIDFQPLDQKEGRPISKKSTVSIDFQKNEMPQESSQARIWKEQLKGVEEAPRNLSQAVPGMAQGYLNSLISMGNLIPGVNIPKANFAPQNEQKQKAEMVGDIASYFGPRGVLALTKIPKAANNALKNYPALQSLLKHAGAGAEAALFGASHAKEGERGIEAGKAGGLGAGMSAANALLTHKMPLLARLGSIGLGAGIGNMFGNTTAGAIAGGLVPQLKGAILGPSKLAQAENALRDVNQAKINKSLAANEKLGTVPTPGQAEGSYVIQGREGALRKRAGKLGEDLEREALDQQAAASKKMLDEIYTPTKQKEKAISAAYKKADQQNLPMEDVVAFKQDPIIKEAFDSVKRQSAFKDIPENNYKFLAQVHRNLWDKRKALSSSLSGQDRILGNEINQARLSFNKALKDKNPDYKEATRLAAPKYKRDEIESIRLNLHDEQLTGKNVYQRLLSTPKKYKEVLKSLDKYPKAQESLKNMREGWREYANIKTGSQAESQAKTRIDQARNILDWVNDFLQSNIGKKATEAQLKYIHSKEWQKGFDLIKQAKTHRESVNKTLDLIGKMGLAYGLSKDEVDNLKSMLTETE